MQSDKEKYLDFWGYTLGTQEAEEAWRLKCEMMNRQAPAVFADLPGYESPVTGKWVEGRAQRREDLRRTGCRPYEEGERELSIKTRKEDERRSDKAAFESAARAYYSLSPEKRRIVRGAF